MSARQRLATDSYLTGLKRRSELASEWFDAIARVFQNDIKEFVGQPQPSETSAFAVETLSLQITGDLPDTEIATQRKPPLELVVSSRCAKMRLVANDPTGWLYIEMSKQSPIYEGVLHRGAIEAALVPHGLGNHELHFVECDWLNADGSDLPNSASAVADKLWDLLFLPQVRHQFAASQKHYGR